jgi:phenylalanyl-tRNA synthetase beta chain
MYIPINRLKKLIPIKDLKTNNKNLFLKYSSFSLNKLTFAGFEVEKVSIKKLTLKKEIIVEISTTPNRADINNLISLSKEVKSLFNRPLKNAIGYKNKIPEFIPNINENQAPKSQNENINDAIYLYQIKNFKIEESPEWLKKRLRIANIEPKNNINDLLNYSVLEWGYPINAYDVTKILKKIAHPEIIKIKIEAAKEGERFITDNNTEYTLNNETLLIKANNITLSIAGILNNKNYQIDENTTHILIESLHLSPNDIKRTNKFLGIRTASSIIFEKGLSKNQRNLAFQHIVKLINLTNKFDIKNAQIAVIDTCSQKYKTIQLDLSNVKNLLGKPKKPVNLFTNLEILSCLKKLNLTIVKIEKNICDIIIPLNRENQLNTEDDLIEEIGRIYGYNNLEAILPKIKKQGKITHEQKLISLIRKSLINHGFFEILTYSLNNLNSNKNIRLLNPLSNEYLSLRNSLLGNLIEATKNNKNQQNSFSSYFEIGRVYNKNLNIENTMVSGIFGGEEYKTNWNLKNQTLNWYEAKEIVNNFLSLVKINSTWVQIKNNLGIEYHPGRSALILNNETIIGTFSQIHPLYAKQNNLIDCIYLFELNLTKISQIKNEERDKYKNFSIYPKITKDISFEVSKEITADQFLTSIKKIILNLNESEIEITVKIFDNYENAKKLQSRVLGIKLSYQSIMKTLNTNEIEKITEKIKAETQKSITKEI